MPYKGVLGPCTYTNHTGVFKLKSYKNVPYGSCTGLMSAVVNQPISVAVDAGGMNWQLYKSGVI